MRNNVESFSVGISDYGVVITMQTNMRKIKEKLYVNDSQIKENFKKFNDSFKYVKGFKRCNLYFNEEDYYENCNCYTTPHFTFDNNLRKVICSLNEHYIIPKEWTEIRSLHLESINSIRTVNKFLEVNNLKLTKDELNEIRKGIKNQESVYLYFDEE